MGATYHLLILIVLSTFHLDFALEKALFCIFVFLDLSHWLCAGGGGSGVAEPPRADSLVLENFTTFLGRKFFFGLGGLCFLT